MKAKPEDFSIEQLQEQVGKAIRAARIDAGISLREVSRRTAIAPANISILENGKLNPTLDTLLKIAKAINCHPKIFFL